MQVFLRTALPMAALGFLAVGGGAALAGLPDRKVAHEAGPDGQQARTAVERGIAFLERDAAQWREEHKCATCHHGTMTVWALSEARNQGDAVLGLLRTVPTDFRTRGHHAARNTHHLRLGPGARQGIKAARFIAAACRGRGHNATLIDPAEERLPLLDRMYKEYPAGEAPETLERLARQIRQADAFIIVSGEYNHSIPPALSNLLDHSGMVRQRHESRTHGGCAVLRRSAPDSWMRGPSGVASPPADQVRAPEPFRKETAMRIRFAGGSRVEVLVLAVVSTSFAGVAQAPAQDGGASVWPNCASIPAAARRHSGPRYHQATAI